MAAAATKAVLFYLVSTGSFPGSTLLQPASASSSVGSSTSSASSSAGSGSSGSSSVSSSGTATTTCDDKSAACFAEQECAGCIAGWGAAETSTSDCEDRFPGVSDEQTCANQGASICCDLGDEATAKECLENRLFTEYWTCFMEGFHCSIDNIPCYDANTVSDSPTAPSGAPTMEPPSAAGSWGSSLSSGDRGFGSSGAPTASPSGAGYGLQSLGEACADVEETCVQDLVCADCHLDAFEIVGVESSQGGGEGYSECRRSYLGLEAGRSASASGSGSGSGSGSAYSEAGICDVIGSAFCCSGSGCQVDGPSVAYWLCVFDFFGCSTEEAACIGGASQSSRSDDDGTGAGGGGGSGNDDAGSSNGGGGVTDSGETTVRSGGAAGGGRRPSAVAYSYFLSAAVAGVLIFGVAPTMPW